MSWENIPASFMPPQDTVRALLNNGTDKTKKNICLAKILYKLIKSYRLNKVSENCVVIVPFCERTFAGQSLQTESCLEFNILISVIIFHNYLINEFLRPAALPSFIILCALFSVEKLKR